MTTRRMLVSATLAAALAWAPGVLAQETLQQVKDLYASAAYEDALGVLSRLQSPGQRLDIERYRVFCLIALDRNAEAETAIRGILSEDPLYEPEEAAPSVVELFKRVKRAATPELARTLYTEGKAAMDRRDEAGAILKFEQLLQLTDDIAVRDELLISELRLLAAGFLDLARTAPAAAKKEPSTVGTSGAAQPATEPVPAAVVTPPVPVEQELPRWVPYSANTRRIEFRGSIKVSISAEGKVTNAEIVTPTDRRYDIELLNAARGWKYQPATRDGLPVPSEKVVTVHLRPK